MSIQHPDILEDFAGPGGWDQGAALLGSTATILGREVNADAAHTAVTAGHVRKLCDVFADDHTQYRGVKGYIASPPCQTFSTAGKGTGRAAIEHLKQAAHLVAYGMAPTAAVEAVHDKQLDERSVLVLQPIQVVRDLRPSWVALEQVPNALPVFKVIAEILEGMGYSVRTETVYAEEYGVPQSRKRAILVAVKGEGEVPWPTKTHSRYHVRTPDRIDEGYPRWVSMAEALTDAGLGVSGEYVRSNYGTGGDPAARGERAADEPAFAVTGKVDRNKWFMGDVRQANGAVRPVELPSATITGAMDNGNFQWVERDGAVVDHLQSGQSVAGEGRATRDMDHPALTVTGTVDRSKWIPEHVRDGQGDAAWTFAGAGQTAVDTAGQQRRPLDAPAHTVTGTASAAWVPEFNDQSGTPYDPEWPAKRPATAVAGRGLVQNPGATANRHNGSTKSRNDGVRVSVAEAGVLQSFPADYPWQGTKSSQYQRVGDAIPPLLAAAILKPLLALTGYLPVQVPNAA